MKNYDFDWQINEFMIYCRSTQLRERTMYSYEQTLRLFERWCADELKIYSVDKVTENVIVFLSFSLASWLLCCFFHLWQPLFMFSCLIIEIGNFIDYTYFRSRMEGVV